MLRRIASVIIVMTLAGCGSGNGSGIGTQGSPLWHMTATSEAKTAAYRRTCISYGFASGTPQMAQCIQTESNNSKAMANKALDNFNRQNNERLRSSRNNSMNCTSRSNGYGTVRTSCN